MKKLVQYLSKTDPGWLGAKRSLKTSTAILISLIFFYNQPRLALLAVISALLFSRSQTGTTIAERKFTMLLTGTMMVILSVPVSLISNHALLSVIFVLLFSFSVFFFIALKLVPDFPAIVILSLSVVEMAFSHTVESGLLYAGLFAMITGLVFVIHFVVFPTRPHRRLQIQTGLMMKNLEEYFLFIKATHSDLDSAIKTGQKANAAFKKSADEFRRLWQLFRISVPSENSVEEHLLNLSMGIERVFDYLVIIWQFRARLWDSSLNKQLIFNDKRLYSAFSAVFETLRHKEDSQKRLSLNRALLLVDALQQEHLKIFSSGSVKATREEWAGVFNTTHTIKVLIEELLILRPEIELQDAGFSAKNKLSGFLDRIKSIGKEIKTGSGAFRFGLRSAIIVGSAQVFYRYVEPDYGYWLVLFAVLLIRPNLGISIRNGWERLLATIIGGLLALGFHSLTQEYGFEYYIILLSGVFLMIWFANLDKPFAMVIALTFVIILVFDMLYSGHEKLVLLRIIYTAGIVLFVIVLSSLLWPEKARKKLANTLADALTVEKEYFFQIIRSMEYNALTVEKNQLKSALELQIKKLDEVMEASISEVLQVKTLTHGLAIRIYIKRLLNTLRSLDINAAQNDCNENMIDVSKIIRQFSTKVLLAFDSIINALRMLTHAENFPELETDLNEITKLCELANEQLSDEVPEIIQLWRNSTFIWNLTPLVKELQGIKSEIELKMQGL
ncbi:MAG: hypothetical protein EOM06_07490 [Sphingobacteriia bacterium]|nr:hypothetical protein [Sphingobacteriia bacterium]